MAAWQGRVLAPRRFGNEVRAGTPRVGGLRVGARSFPIDPNVVGRHADKNEVGRGVERR